MKLYFKVLILICVQLHSCFKIQGQFYPKKSRAIFKFWMGKAKYENATTTPPPLSNKSTLPPLSTLSAPRGVVSYLFVLKDLANFFKNNKNEINIPDKIQQNIQHLWANK